MPETTRPPISRTVRLSLLLAGAVMAVVLVAGVAACGGKRDQDEGKVLRLGLLVIEGDNLAGISRAYREVGELVRGEVEAAGGVKRPEGRAPLDLRVYPHGEDVESALRAMRLAASEGCQAIIGGALSRQALPMAALAEELRVPFISPGSTHPALVGRRAYVFRASYDDTFQSRALARLTHDGGAQTAAIFYNRSDVYASNLAEGFATSFRALGGRIAADQSYAAAPANLSEAMLPLARSKPDVLFLIAYYSDVPDQIRRVRDLGYTGEIVGPDSWDLLSGDQPRELYGARFLVVWHPGAPQSEAGREFLERFTARFGHQPTSVEALVRDAIGLALLAASSAQRLEPGQMRQELARIKEFEGVAGRAVYQDGTPARSALVMEVSSRGVQYVQTITPEAVQGR